MPSKKLAPTVFFWQKASARPMMMQLTTIRGMNTPRDSLSVVNCIIIGRAEAFCQKNPIGPSFVDGITQGLGYTVVLVVMCVIRELLGSGRFGGGLIDLAKGITLDGTGEGIQIFNSDFGASILTLPVGGFLTLGFLFAAMQAALKKAAKKKEAAAKNTEKEDEAA